MSSTMSPPVQEHPAGTTPPPLDERLVVALCRAAQSDPGDAEAVVRRHVSRLAPLASTPERDRLVRAAVARLAGLGTLDALLEDVAVDEVLVNSHGDVWVESFGSTRLVSHLGPDDLAIVIERILAPLGRRLDRVTPVVDARLADGSRICAVIPPVAPDGPCLSLRRFRDRSLPLAAFGDEPVAVLLDEMLRRRANVIVSGATSSGKTSLLNSILGRVPAGERIVTIEDTAELLPTHDHLVRLEARPASPDGLDAITLADLVRTAMRLRPDRLVVGEVRGPEVVGLVQALNTGHDGSWSTCHANSAADALQRLETLVLQAAPTWPLTAIRRHLVGSIDIVVHVERTTGGARRVREIAEFAEHLDERDQPSLRPLVIDGVVSHAFERARR
ncbi:MAG: CpaF family protein [Desertimonas sp.]